MNSPSQVEVEVYGGQTVKRIAAKVIGNKVLIVTRKEYENSIMEERSANGIGFDIEKVVFLNE